MIKKIFAIIISLLTVVLGIFGLSQNIDTSGQDAEIVVFADIPYGQHERNVFDLALPDNGEEELGLVLFIHGGAWIYGDKSEYTSAVSTCAQNMQMAAAAMNYRYLSADVTMSDILEDIDAALAEIKETAQMQGIKITRVLLTGYSAGAHLSMLYAYKCKDTAPVAPAAVFSYSGPTDLNDENFYEGNSLGSAQEICILMSYACGRNFTPATIAEAAPMLSELSPVSYVSEACCPTAICHGKKDTIVPYTNAENIIAAFENNGVSYDFITYPNSGHELGYDPDCTQEAETLFAEYITTYLK